MFSRSNNRQPGRGMRGIFGKKDTGGKKHQSRVWMMINKKRNEEKHREQPIRTPEFGVGGDRDDDDNGVMMSASSSPSLQPSVPMAGYVELPDEPRPGKITPSTPTTNTTNSSPSPRASKSETTGNGGASSPEVEEAIEEAVPIVRSTLPSPEPRPLIERNGFKGSHDRVDGNGLKAKPVQHDVDDDSCLIKCVYFTQQCCECVIV